MQFLVIAYDGTDSEAKQRRLNVRETHLKSIMALKDAGAFKMGGALLDEAGEMIGSTLFVEFDSREALDKWLEAEPYITGGVWVDIEVKPVRIVSL